MERIRPSTGVKTWLYTEGGMEDNEKGWCCSDVPWDGSSSLKCAKIFHSSAFLFKMSFCQFSGESTQFRMLTGAAHSIVQRWQLFELPPAEL